MVNYIFAHLRFYNIWDCVISNWQTKLTSESYNTNHRKTSLNKSLTSLLPPQFETSLWSLLPDSSLTPSPNPCNLFRQRMSISCNDAIVATVVWLYHSPCLPKYIYTHITYFLSHNTCLCITIWVWKIIFCKNWKSQFNIITEETMPLWSAPSRSDTGSTWSLDTSHIFHRNIFLITANPTQTALNSPDQTQSYMWMVGWDW